MPRYPKTYRHVRPSRLGYIARNKLDPVRVRREYMVKHPRPLATQKHQVFFGEPGGVVTAKYSGPGTNIIELLKDKVEPINFPDLVAQGHDIGYSLANTEAKIAAADNLMLSHLDKYRLARELAGEPFSTTQSIDFHGARGGIALKRTLGDYTYGFDNMMNPAIENLTPAEYDFLTRSKATNEARIASVMAELEQRKVDRDYRIANMLTPTPVTSTQQLKPLESRNANTEAGKLITTPSEMDVAFQAEEKQRADASEVQRIKEKTGVDITQVEPALAAKIQYDQRQAEPKKTDATIASEIRMDPEIQKQKLEAEKRRLAFNEKKKREAENPMSAVETPVSPLTTPGDDSSEWPQAVDPAVERLARQAEQRGRDWGKRQKSQKGPTAKNPKGDWDYVNPGNN